MAGAPKRNGNAEGLGLYASNPPREVQVLADAQPTTLAGFGRGMGESALWVAEALTLVIGEVDGRAMHEANKIIGLYAAVAQECLQVAAELEGATGIKPAALGNLSEQAYERLMERQARALELILNQCEAAVRRLQHAEEIRAAAANENGILPLAGGLLVWTVKGYEPHPALQYLAAHMRSAKRILREMAANRAWRDRGQELESDLGERLREVILNGTK